jgi:hypothetical protein
MSAELEAGRELDALIAERVLGYPGAAIGGWDNPRTLPDGRILPNLTPRPYSTEIRWAWVVVEKLRDLGFSLRWRAHNCRWYAYFVWGADDAADADADTAPLAICRAALKARALTPESESTNQLGAPEPE